MKRAAQHLISVDRHLGRIISEVGPCRLKRPRGKTPFLALAESIAYQQLTGKAAATIWGRVLNLCGGAHRFSPAAVLRTTDEELRGAGLSRSKVAAMRSLAEHAERRIVPSWERLEVLDDDEIIERLTQVRGIGPWSVQMMLIFSLGRPDVLPTTDYGVQKGFSIVYRRDELPKPKDLLAFGETWRPFRSYAAWYLWRATDLRKNGGDSKKRGGGRAG